MKKKSAAGIKILICLFVLTQLVLVFFAQLTTRVNTDGIFSYTLANNPYNYLFIDGIYEQFPTDNGWLDAHILKENYVVETYDRFNYAAVYHHQRHDVHPPLYYFMVHTLSSLFPGTYSNMFALGVNLFALFLIDLLMIRLFCRIYGHWGYAAVPLSFLLLMHTMLFLYTWARMYMLLFLFCLWYLSLHEKLFRDAFSKADLAQMVLCIFLGTLTHYYFYVYAASLTLLTLFYLMWKKRKRQLFGYLYAGFTGLAASWIFYPWVFWHIFVNEQNHSKHQTPWSFEKLKILWRFLDNRLFNGRIGIAAAVLAALVLAAALSGREAPDREAQAGRIFRRFALGSGILYFFVIFNLDEDNPYYSTAFYMAFIIWFSMLLLDLSGRIRFSRKREGMTTLLAVVCAVLICSPSAVGRYVDSMELAVSRMRNGIPPTGEYDAAARDHRGYDCIYIQKKQDNLFNNFFFEFGEYGQFKKIPLETFNRQGITAADLEGREHMDNGVVVYVPEECVCGEESYRLVASDGGYHMYEWIGEE